MLSIPRPTSFCTGCAAAAADLKDYEVGIAMNVMIRGFHGGVGTAWAPLNRKVCDLVRMLSSEVRAAGVSTFLVLMKGVDMAGAAHNLKGGGGIFATPGITSKPSIGSLFFGPAFHLTSSN